VEHIKAIETNYKGYKFRSRLEARWAVFFDTAEIAWEYEPEGYILSDGTKYLPDFYLPTEEMFVEVKGVIPNDSIDSVIGKLELFSKEKGKPILLVIGILGDGECFLYAPFYGEWKNCFLSVSIKGKALAFVTSDFDRQLTVNEGLNAMMDNAKNHVLVARNKAITAMKSARFEFL